MGKKEAYIKGTLFSLDGLKSEKNNYEVDFLGKKFVIFPGVFSPRYFQSPQFSLRNVKISKGEKVLEIGCGAGIFSVMAALSGASKVVSVDIASAAVDNTKENGRLHSVSDIIDARKGDVYSPIKDGEKFNLIFWNVPFLHTEDENIEELKRTVFDPKYKSIRKFIIEARNHLESNGRLIMEFSSSMGDFDKVKEFFKEADMSYEILCQERTDYGEIMGIVNLELIEAKPKN